MVTIRKPEDANGGGEPTGPPSDIFDNLAALRLEPDAAALVGAVEILAHVLIRRPSPTEWVRVHPDADMTLATSCYVDRENRETYLVVPEMREVLITGVKVMLLVTAVTSRGSVFLWPLALGDDTGRTNAWHETARDAAMRAKSAWTKRAAECRPLPHFSSRGESPRAGVAENVV